MIRSRRPVCHISLQQKAEKIVFKCGQEKWVDVQFHSFFRSVMEFVVLSGAGGCESV